MDWYIEVLKKYAVFEGRARRKEYWYFVLFNIIAASLLVAIDFLIGTFPLLYAVYFLAVFVPSLAVTVRRLHDTNRSGWWIFICFVPFIGSILMLIYLVQESDSGENQFGPNPKGMAAYC